MLIYIKTPTNRTIELNVESNESMSSVKKKIFDHTEIPPDQQTLVFAMKMLEDGGSLYDYGIGHKRTLQVLHRRRGTGDAKPAEPAKPTTDASTLEHHEPGDAEPAEPTTDASANKSQQYWEEKAKTYDFDEDLYMVDPQSHFHMLRQLERDVVQRSEYMRSGGICSTSRLFEVKWGAESLEGILNATREIPRWLKEKIVEMVPVRQVRFT